METEDDDHVEAGVIRKLDEETISPAEKGSSDLNVTGDRNEMPDQMVRIIDDEKKEILTPVTDPYRYTLRDGGTSCELFKIEIHNIPRYTSYATLKKLFSKFSLKPQKIKLIGNPVKFAFVALANEEDRQTALQSLAGFVWKGQQLSVAVAGPKADPLAVKRMADDVEGVEKKVKSSAGDCDGAASDRSVSEELNDQVAGLWRLPYLEQLEAKTKIVQDFLVELHRDISRMLDHSQNEASVSGGKDSKDRLFKWFMWSKKNCDKKPCIADPIEGSPVVNGYRNKCEFSIDVDKTVGFRLGCYKKGLLRVASVADCPIVSTTMKKIVLIMEQYMKDVSKLKPFDPLDHTGHWKQVMVRVNSSGDSSMIVLTMEPKSLSDAEIEAEQRSLCDFVTANVPSASVYMEVLGRKSQRLRLIRGSASITEHMTINGKELCFQVSPDAFFQINTPAAQICYEKIAEQLQLSKQTLLLDVCCGTGTIGISLAAAVAHVVGIELNADAVKDAEKNATVNKVTNIEFMAGKAEDLVSKVISNPEYHAKYEEIVAVIDPPRAGLSELMSLSSPCLQILSFFLQISL